ncbi:hypothetical protein TNCV_3401501 [Trichonephila clavipes]|nr:hypothetical protein TNCV_3401501 [Trichonephila clavipes]
MFDEVSVFFVLPTVASEEFVTVDDGNKAQWSSSSVLRFCTAGVRVLFQGWTDHLIRVSARAPQDPMVTYTVMVTVGPGLH